MMTNLSKVDPDDSLYLEQNNKGIVSLKGMKNQEEKYHIHMVKETQNKANVFLKDHHNEARVASDHPHDDFIT